MNLKNNLVLIGFMGVGKGTIARALAENLGVFAIDCDDLIESFANKKISQIFADSGEAKFRQIEQNLAKFLQKNVSGCIISTGGGFYKVKNLAKIGKIIYLKSDFDAIINRLKNSPNSEKKFAKRPLLNDLNKAREIFNERQNGYESVADLIVNVANREISDIVSEIKTKLKDKK